MSTAQEITCSGCAARYRMHLGAGAPLKAELACPRCGAPIVVRRETAVVEEQPLLEKDRRQEIETSPKGWQSIDASAVFGRTAAPPPMATSAPVSEKAGLNFAQPAAPRLGLFGGPPRSPEADRPDPVRPLASALLKELKLRRSTEEAPAREMLAEPPIAADAWLSEELIADAVDAAAEELFVVDDSPVPFERLPGAQIDDDEDFEVSPSQEIELPEPQVLPEPPELPPPAPKSAAVEPAPVEEALEEVTVEMARPPLPTEPAPPAQPTSPTEVPAPQTLYRLRVGTRVYAGITFDGLMQLVRRGIWIIADEIAEDGGDWMPVEEHPVFEKVRRLITEGLTGLLLTHAELVEDEAALAPGSTSETTTTATATIRRDQTPTSVLDKEVVPAVRVASATLPWTIALVSTGVASALTGAAVTYALLGAPSFGPETSEFVEPPAAVALALTAEQDEEARLLALSERRRNQAVNHATDLVRDALEIDGIDLARTALERGEFARARQIAAAHYRTAASPGRLQQIFDAAVKTDPFLEPRKKTLVPDEHGDVLRALGGGASVTFRVQDGGENRYAYKVNRQEWEEGWRVEVAAYLLCEILPCGFDIPVNDTARISRQDFDELYGRLDTPRQKNYAEQRFDELIWQEESGPDGVQREYLYGTLKEWIPRYTNLPIEYVSTWQNLLDLSQDEALLDEPFSAYLARVRPYREGHFARGLEREYHFETSRELARQISNLMVFDYLVSNFDRFSGIEAYYGVNAHFADSRFVAIDNSAAFQFRPLSVMDNRLARVGRFDRTLIDAIRLLNPDVVDPVLFPDADGRERVRLQTFWLQRDKLLTHVDALIEEFGEDAVFAF